MCEVKMDDGTSEDHKLWQNLKLQDVSTFLDDAYQNMIWPEQMGLSHMKNSNQHHKVTKIIH